MSSADPVSHSGKAITGGEVLGSRQVALRLLDGVLRQKQTLDTLLENEAGYCSLPSKDKSFCRMLVSTTLRRMGQIDALIGMVEDKPGGASKTPDLQNILRLGVTQLFFMATADHAAVDTSVRLAEANGLGRQRGFVNAILRNLQRTGLELLPKLDAPRLNTPDWLLKTWIADYGLGAAAEIAAANLVEAPLDITVKDPESLNYWGNTLQAASFPSGSLRAPSGGSVSELQGFDDGMWWVQDASAAIPARLFGDVAGRHVVDLCAAPGGKTAQLAAQGAFVTALDRSASRIKRLNENMQRLRLEDRVESIVADAGDWRPKQAPEMILLDAPCSATGTVRRHPDVVYLKGEKDVQRLADIQGRLLRHAFDILAPGGVLVYCTCSLQKAEGEHQIARFLSETPDAVKIAIAQEEIGDMEELVTEDGDLRILPFMRAASGGMDGFFVCRLRKK